MDGITCLLGAKPCGLKPLRRCARVAPLHHGYSDPIPLFLFPPYPILPIYSSHHRITKPLLAVK